MDTTNEKETTDTTVDARIKVINDATNGLFTVVMKLAKEDDAPPGVDALLTHSLTLVNCGLIALTEIADAQQRIAALAEVQLATEIEPEPTKRSFIGRNKNSD